MKKILSVVILLVVGYMFLSGCRKKAPEQPAKPKEVPAVKAVQAIEGRISKTLELTGSVTATKVARMGSPAEGPITQCQVREGDQVAAGQVLLTIGRKKAADAQVEAARDSLTREQEEFKRITQLVDSGSIAGEELEMGNLKVSKAKAELSKAMESVGDYQIASPWDGVVSNVFVTEGYYVSPREHLVEIYDAGSTVVEFSVPESQAATVYKGMPVHVELDAYPGRELKGEMTRIYPELNRQTRTRTAEATIVSTKDISLLPGMFARILLVLETVENAVLIPDKAIVMSRDNTPLAFVIHENKVEARTLVLGLEKDHQVQVVQGISPGDRVVTEGNGKLRTGSVVKLIGNVGENELDKKTAGHK